MASKKLKKTDPIKIKNFRSVCRFQKGIMNLYIQGYKDLTI